VPDHDQTISSRRPVDAGRPNPPPIDRSVLMVTAGGLEHGGGIGRMVGYVVSAWNDQLRPPMRVIDTRGPKYQKIMWPFFFLRSIFQIAKSAPGHPLLHLHLAANTSTLRKVIIAYVARFLGLTYLIHLHDPVYEVFYTNLTPWARSAVKSMFAHAARVIVLGTPAALTVARVLGVPSERIDIVPNAVPGPGRSRLERSNDQAGEPRIIFLGQLQRRKGVGDLIDALARPEVAALRWSAVFAGGGPDQVAYEAQMVRLGLKGRIEFPGWLTEGAVRALLDSADILVLPSYAEEMAMSVLEGMAFGLCIVCTPVGALAEVVADGVSGRVVAPGDIPGLAAALAGCIGDPELRGRLGSGARQAYLERYNIVDYPDRIAAVYRRT
jgi:glycosyltransferase involved in cell wall biosynthesis